MRFRRFVAAWLILSFSGMALPLPASAAMLGTDAALASSERERVSAFLDRAAVRAQLEAQGVNAAAAKARLAALSDEEVAKISGQIDRLPAGGDAVGAILGTALLVFVILLITDLLGLTHVFPFVKPINK